MNVVDNLESTETSLPLSANMGRELNEYIMTVEEYAAEIEERVIILENEQSEEPQNGCELKIWS